jgi:4-amino-4-deoxy-L-arabinose transferase-like glycosyltransferase
MVSAKAEVYFIGKICRLISGMDSRISFGLILVVAALTLVGHLDMMPLWGSEGRWATISRHMFNTGELFEPLLGNSVYWDKPLLSYWATLPFAYINGGVNETVIRLPSVIAALLLLALTFDLARKWFETQTALWSMVILSTSYGFIFWARNAQVEMVNAFFILLAIWYFLKHKAESSPGWLYILGCIMALGAGFKGLPACGVPVFSIALLLTFKREWPPAMNWRHIIGTLILSVTIYIGFQLICCYFSGTWAPLDLVWRENIIRFFMPFDHKGPIWTYFIRIFDLVAPWSLLLPAAMVYLLPKLRTRSSNTTELFVLFGGVFIFFTLSGSRRSYYLLPIMPFFSILTGRFIVDFIKSQLARPFDLYVKVFGFLLSIALAAPLFILLTVPGALPDEVTSVDHGLWLIFVAMALVSPVVSVGIISRSSKALAGSMMAVWLIYALVAVPLFDRMPNIRNQVAHVKSLGRPIGFFPSASDRVWFYLDQPCRVFAEQDAAFDWAVRNEGVLIVKDSHKNKLPAGKWNVVENLKTCLAVIPVTPGLKQNVRLKKTRLNREHNSGIELNFIHSPGWSK